MELRLPMRLLTRYFMLDATLRLMDSDGIALFDLEGE